MAENSKIEWTDHTFNPWVGCMKVSDGCKHCYAETLNHRWGHDNWGPAATTQRRKTSVANWKEPRRWNKAAAQSGERKRVFCASMADVFEDNQQVALWRAELLDLIADTPALDWLLLTKRPQHVNAMTFAAGHDYLPLNVWIGTSVEHQEAADERIPLLLGIPATVRFLSCEPLLGPVDLTRVWASMPGGATLWNVLRPNAVGRIDWVIVGGESGGNARPMAPEWARSLRDQCQAAGVAFHFKQWGEFTPYYEAVEDGRIVTKEYAKGVARVGKKVAGRLLDDRTWDELPAAEPLAHAWKREPAP